jgi:hypothetical protein
MPSYRKDYGPQGCAEGCAPGCLLVLGLFGVVLAVVRPRRKRGVR